MFVKNQRMADGLIVIDRQRANEHPHSLTDKDDVVNKNHTNTFDRNY